MCVKNWSSERWDCPICGLQVAAKQKHGIEDCVTHLQRQFKSLNKCCKREEAKCRELALTVVSQQKIIDTLNEELYKSNTRRKVLAEELAYADFKETELA